MTVKELIELLVRYPADMHVSAQVCRWRRMTKREIAEARSPDGKLRKDVAVSSDGAPSVFEDLLSVKRQRERAA